MAVDLQPVVLALAKIGATLVEDDKAKWKAAFDPIADEDANALVSALAAHIELHGLAGLEQNPVRNALTGSEPTIDTIINSNVSAALDAVQATLEKMAAK